MMACVLVWKMNHFLPMFVLFCWCLLLSQTVLGEIVIQGSSVTLPAIPTTPCHTGGIPGGALRSFTLKNVTIVYTNWSVTNIYNIPQAPSNVSSPGIVIRTPEGVSGALYIDGVARLVRDRGYVLVIETNRGDITWTGHLALHASGTYSCPIPTLLLPDVPYAETLNQFSPLILESVTYDLNPEIAFIEGPVYIIGISIPLFAIALLMFTLAARALWRNGFPYVFNAGSVLCIIGLGMSLLMCKLSERLIRLISFIHFQLFWALTASRDHLASHGSTSKLQSSS
jgi:hypothetical protein